MLQVFHPTWTGQEIEDNFVFQEEVSELAWGSNLDVKAIAADRILIRTRYGNHISGNQTGPGVCAVSLVDPYTGVLKWQKYSVMGSIRQFYDTWPTQFGAWIVARLDIAGVYYDEIFLLEDFGATETVLTVPSNVFSIYAPTYNRIDAGPTNINPPLIYFIVDESGERVLYSTDDYFMTTKRCSVIGTIVNTYDFVNVFWAGTSKHPAPIDPTFPWRTDSREPIPDWWINVTAYGG